VTRLRSEYRACVDCIFGSGVELPESLPTSAILIALRARGALAPWCNPRKSDLPERTESGPGWGSSDWLPPIFAIKWGEDTGAYA